MNNAREFASRLVSLLRREQAALAEFLLALAEFDRRRLWQKLGYTSLFHFLHRELGMSKGAAHYRKTAAELIQRVPAVVQPLRDGRLCITSIIELAKVLTPENREEVLPRFFHRSRQEAKAVSAELRPMEAAPHRTVVTAMHTSLPTLRASASAPLTEVLVQPVELAMSPQVTVATPPGARTEPPAWTQAAPLPPRGLAEPLTADLRRLHVTVSKRFMGKLEAARDALSHSHPGAEVEAILEAGLDLLIERAEKRRGLVERPRAKVNSPSTEDGPGSDEQGSRHVPAAVKREVWIRDEGRCQWKLESGGLCGSTHRLQFDHIRPVALGGTSTVENGRILCAAHNLVAARRIFGDAFMDRYARGRSPGAVVGTR